MHTVLGVTTFDDVAAACAPDGGRRYSAVLADPPWRYSDPLGDRGVWNKYPTMTPVQVASMRVSAVCADDCVLFLWTTMPHLPTALSVVAAWGFTYKTVAFTWVKRNRVSSSWFWGMGRWTRSNAELCLLATRGRPRRVDGGVHSVVDSPVGRHSSKPPEVKDRIVRLVGDVPRIELFARERTAGWDAWGLELPGGPLLVG